MTERSDKLEIQHIMIDGADTTGKYTMYIRNGENGTIEDTDYWETDQSKKGLFFISINAGTMRLLVPYSCQKHLWDMTNDKVKEVVATLGPLQPSMIPAIELMFEDNGKSPFSIHIERRQMDRDWPPSDDNRMIRFRIYSPTSDGDTAQVWECRRCFTRRAFTLPCLEQFQHPGWVPNFDTNRRKH